MGSFSSISPAPVFSTTNVSFAPGRSWHGSLGVKPPLIVGRPGINRSVQEVEERSWAPKRRRVKSITAAVKMYLQLDLEESILAPTTQSLNRGIKRSKEWTEHKAGRIQTLKADGRGRYIFERRRAPVAISCSK